MIIFFLFIILFGFFIFSFISGASLFRMFCVRKVYEKNSFVDKASHVHDEKIMNPLLNAKNQFNIHDYEKIIVITKTHKLIGFLKLQKNNKAPLAILVHGFSDSAQGLAYLANTYFLNNFSVLIINLRGHGQSSGKYAGLGFKKTDGKDIHAFLQYLKKYFSIMPPFLLHGISMGAAAVINTAYTNNNTNLPFLVIADSGVASFSKQVFSNIRALFPKGIIHSFISYSFYAGASLYNFFINGFFLFQHKPVNILLKTKNNNIPLIIFHGKNDTLVPYTDAQDLFNVAPCPKTLLIINHAPHIGAYFYAPKEYMNLIYSHCKNIF